MRELNFLPEWYPVVRRHRRATIVQAWATLAIVAGMLLWACAARYRVFVASSEVGWLRSQTAAMQPDLARLDTLVVQQRRWSDQGEVLSRLGASVESTRLISLIASAMPANVSLTSVTFATEEKQMAVQTVSMAKNLKEPPLDRTLRIHVQGIAPSDAEVADLMAKLGAVPFLQEVSMSYARDSEQAGHMVREFDVSFAMSLNLGATVGGSN